MSSLIEARNADNFFMYVFNPFVKVNYLKFEKWNGISFQISLLRESPIQIIVSNPFLKRPRWSFDYYYAFFCCQNQKTYVIF